MIYKADHFSGVEYDTENPVLILDGPKGDTNRNHCHGRGWITRDTFLSHMQRGQNVHWKSVISDSAQVFPCALEELGLETTSLDPYACIWDYPDNCFVGPSKRRCQHGEARYEVLYH